MPGILTATASLTIGGIAGHNAMAICDAQGEVTLRLDERTVAASGLSPEENVVTMQTTPNAALKALVDLIGELRQRLSAESDARATAVKENLDTLQEQLK